MSRSISPFLKEVAAKFGVAPESLLEEWKITLEHVAHIYGRLPDDLTSDDYIEAQSYLEADIEKKIAEDPLNPAKFIDSSLDANAYLDSIIIQSSPEGQEINVDDKTRLTNPAAGFKAAGLMAPNGSVGEEVESPSIPKEDDTPSEEFSAAIDELIRKKGI